MSREHLNHFYAVADKEVVIHEFLAWLVNRYGVELDYSGCTKDNPVPLDHRILVDQFLKIDRAGIESERRAIVEQARSLN